MIGFLLLLTLYFIFAVGAVLSVCSFFGQYNFWFEMLSNFRVAFVLVFAVQVLIFFLLRRMVVIWLAIGLFSLNIWALVPFYLAIERTSPADAPKLKVLQFNVRGGQNHDFDRTLNVIKREQPDLVGISEITPTWEKKLFEGLKEYRYRISEPHLGGIVVLSRFPLKNQEVRYFEKIKRPRITADIEVAGKTIRLLMVHPVIPLVGAKMRDRELEVYAQEVKSSNLPFVLFGDLNTTPFSYYFDRLLKDASLRDTEKGFGYHATWPVDGKFGGPFFPIDHCLTTGDFEVVDRRVLEEIGSDHRPVVVELSILLNGS